MCVLFSSTILLTLDAESGKKLVKVLLYLITKGKITKEDKFSKKIKEESLRILFRHFNQRKEFIDVFKQVLTHIGMADAFVADISLNEIIESSLSFSHSF